MRGEGEVPGLNPERAENKKRMEPLGDTNQSVPSQPKPSFCDLLGESQRSRAWERSSPDLAGGLQAQTHITQRGCSGFVRLRANYDINIIRAKEPKSPGKIPDCRGRAGVR